MILLYMMMGLGIVGFLVALFGSVWLLVEAFKTHVLWGLAYIFVPFAALIFLFLHWDVSKKPFLMGLVGIAVVFASLFLSLHQMKNSPEVQANMAQLLVDAGVDLEAAGVSGFDFTGAGMSVESGGTPSTEGGVGDSAQPGASLVPPTAAGGDLATRRQNLNRLFMELNEWYEALERQKVTIDTSDPQAVEKYNQEAALYRNKLESARQEQAALQSASE